MNRSDEFEVYIGGPPATSIAKTALDWWLEPTQMKNFPRLSRMAIDILSIPLMSAESERVFSGARRTISWERHSLGADVVEQSECIKSWMRLLVQDGRNITQEAIEEVLRTSEESSSQFLGEIEASAT